MIIFWIFWVKNKKIAKINSSSFLLGFSVQLLENSKPQIWLMFAVGLHCSRAQPWLPCTTLVSYVPKTAANTNLASTGAGSSATFLPSTGQPHTRRLHSRFWFSHPHLPPLTHFSLPWQPVPVTGTPRPSQAGIVPSLLPTTTPSNSPSCPSSVKSNTALLLGSSWPSLCVETPQPSRDLPLQ